MDEIDDLIDSYEPGRGARHREQIIKQCVALGEARHVIEDALAEIDEEYEEEHGSYPCPDCGYDSRSCGCPQFADPGGNSALRAATPDNPRDQPCPTCGEPDRLTPADVSLGYQCDACADRAERGGY